MINLKSPTKFEKILSLLKDEILHGKFKPEERFYSDNTLAAKYGVSHVTAAKVISALLHEGLVSRVQGLGTFVTERSPSRGSPIVGLLTDKHSAESYGWGEYFQALSNLLEKRGMFFASFPPPPADSILCAIEKFVEQKPVGLLIDCEFYVNLSNVCGVIKEIPTCVICECPAGCSELPSVLLDKRKMYRSMLEKLSADGHEHILFYGYIPELWPQQKVWYDGAVLDFTHEHPNAQVSYASCTDKQTTYQERLSELLSGNNPPTGIVAMSDYLAYQVLNQLQTKGLHISSADVVGVGSTIWSRQPGQEFSSLKIDYTAMFELAMSCMKAVTDNSKLHQETFTEWTFVDHSRC